MLKFKINTLEGLSDVEKSHYKKVGEEYVLDLDVAIKTDDDIRKLQNALEKERADHKEVKLKLAGFKYDPAEIDKTMTELEELRIRANKIDDKAISDLVSVRVKPFEKEKEKLSSELATILKEKETLKSKLLDMRLNDAVRSVSDGVVDPLAIPDAVLRAKTMLSYNEEKDGFFDKDGFAVKDWLEKMLPTTNWGLKSSGAGSKGREFSSKSSITIGEKTFDAKNNPFAKETMNLTEQSLIYKANPALAEELAKIAEQK
jgi:hypothetical protein